MSEKEDIPSHLRHIDKSSKETQDIINKLGGDQTTSRPKKKPIYRRAPTEDDPLKIEIEDFFDRLDQPYCSLKEDNKANLKNKIVLLRKKDPKGCLTFIKGEEEKLDEQEKEYNLKKSKEKDLGKIQTK